MIENWNIDLFTLLNAAPNAPGWSITIARLLAAWPVWGACGIVIFLWVRGVRDGRAALVATGFALLISLTSAFCITLLWPHPRPAQLELGQQYLFHVAEPSFPSDHVTFLLTIAFGFMASSVLRCWGGIVLMLAVGTAWARVYVGIHFPFDMLGALGLAVISTVIANFSEPVLTRYILPLIEKMYNTVVRMLHLPPSIFPR